MSATGRGAERRPSDYYPTPAWCVRRLLEEVYLPSGRWLEPSAGDGAIIRAVNAVRRDVEWWAVELRPECRESLEKTGAHVSVGVDYLRHSAGHFDVALLNPPFSEAQAFIDRAKESAEWVVVLESLNFFGSEERNDWWRADVPDVYVIPNRPSFTGAGMDSVVYGWFVWTPERGRSIGRVRVLASTPAAERRVPRLVIPEGVGAPAQKELIR